MRYHCFLWLISAGLLVVFCAKTTLVDWGKLFLIEERQFTQREGSRSAVHIFIQINQRISLFSVVNIGWILGRHLRQDHSGGLGAALPHRRAAVHSAGRITRYHCFLWLISAGCLVVCAKTTHSGLEALPHRRQQFASTGRVRILAIKTFTSSSKNQSTDLHLHQNNTDIVFLWLILTDSWSSSAPRPLWWTGGSSSLYKSGSSRNGKLNCWSSSASKVPSGGLGKLFLIEERQFTPNEGRSLRLTHSPLHLRIGQLICTSSSRITRDITVSFCGFNIGWILDHLRQDHSGGQGSSFLISSSRNGKVRIFAVNTFTSSSKNRSTDLHIFVVRISLFFCGVNIVDSWSSSCAKTTLVDWGSSSS
ncbi:hypothetical protein AVEN_134702-1 [Araneus ventricosus]|uniref:Uncharacterized protein n=1 Tax=Araneus ventricosus TaxID=182803 RepID=A0A4Y2HV44_ARAVE|nr:hypothetical protein AVEN_134702-1 [Araneus ventricosus]